jgi:hypothetical protein
MEVRLRTPPEKLFVMYHDNFIVNGYSGRVESQSRGEVPLQDPAQKPFAG